MKSSSHICPTEELQYNNYNIINSCLHPLLSSLSTLDLLFDQVRQACSVYLNKATWFDTTSPNSRHTMLLLILILSHLEERRVLVAVVVLLSRVLPGNPENAFLVIFPNQAGILPAVNLIDEPLSKFTIPTTD